MKTHNRMNTRPHEEQPGDGTPHERTDTRGTITWNKHHVRSNRMKHTPHEEQPNETTDAWTTNTWNTHHMTNNRMKDKPHEDQSCEGTPHEKTKTGRLTTWRTPEAYDSLISPFLRVAFLSELIFSLSWCPLPVGFLSESVCPHSWLPVWNILLWNNAADS